MPKCDSSLNRAFLALSLHSDLSYLTFRTVEAVKDLDVMFKRF